MYSYYTYGLGIHSEIPLPEFIDSDVEGDVLIRLENSDLAPRFAKFSRPYFKFGIDETIISLEGVGTFLIQKGREIIIIPDHESDIRRIRRYIVGTVMAILLYQRGYLVLHASSVKFNEHAVAFLGTAGSGKSSLAAAFHTIGYGIITDDVSVVDMNNKRPIVYPGFPQIRLGSEAADAVGVNDDARVLLDDDDNKFIYRVDHGFTDTPLPLWRIYILEEHEKIGIEPLSAQSAVIELVRYSLPTRWVQLKDANHFFQCVNFAKAVPAYSLKRNSTIQTLPMFARVVDSHLRGRI